MNELQIYKNDTFGAIRTLEINGVAWFVGKDVAEVLAYNEPHKAITRHVDSEDRTKHPILSSGGTQDSWLINESGLYSLILSSKLPTAKEFKRWVTSEVLPSIRKHGAYMTPETLEAAILNPDYLIQIATALKEEREKRKLLETENAQQKQIIGELKPRADYTDRILSNKGLVTITQIAKDYGMSGRKMNKILEDLHVQYKQSGQWLLYAEYHDKGYTHSKTIDITRKDGTPDVTMETKWTQKGRLFIYELLKGEGILPIIEREQMKK